MAAFSRTLVAATATWMIGAAPAFAFGDRCNYPAVSAGGKGHALRETRAKATDAWEHAVRHKHGANFANWSYSADRSISCSWDAAGTHFKCTATAAACARVGR